VLVLERPMIPGPAISISVRRGSIVSWFSSAGRPGAYENVTHSVSGDFVGLAYVGIVVAMGAIVFSFC